MLDELGELIRFHRKQKRWSQMELAVFSGLDRTTIGALERDDYSDIGIRKVQRVLEILELTLAVNKAGIPTLDDLKEQNHG